MKLLNVLLRPLARLRAARFRTTPKAVGELERARQDLRTTTEELERTRRELADRDQQEKSAALSLRRLEKAVETMSLGVTISDVEGRILYANPADARNHGYDVTELIGKNASLYSPNGSTSAADDDSDSIYLRPWTRERDNVTRDGRIFPARLVSDMVRDDHGLPIGMVTICEDISERKRIEEAREKMTREFISTVNHELRTPLTSIIASLGLLQSGHVSTQADRSGELITVAQRNANRLLQLINDLLDLQKLAARRIVFQPIVIDVESLLEEAVRGNQAFADSLGVRLVPTKIPWQASVYADRGRLLQVLDNLLSNAVKFSPTGAEILLKARTSEHSVVISIADQGPGIPDEFRHRLFEQFSQLDSSPTRAMGGSGLGLSIVKGLVDGMGGQLSLATKIGSGTTFYVEMPSPGGLREDNTNS